MKLLYAFAIAVLLITSCKKEVHEKVNIDVFKTMKAFLKDSLSMDDYSGLDFSRVVCNRVDSAGLYFMRVPFKEKAITESFVIVKIKNNTSVEAGKIIRLDGGVRNVGVGPVTKWEWGGSISISSLNRRTVLNSGVHNGYIDAFHQNASLKEAVLGADVLPEVFVVAYVQNPDAFDYSTWLWLNSLFYSNTYGGGGGSETGSGGYYGSLDGGGGGGGSSYAGSGGETGAAVDETMFVDLDVYSDRPAIDVEQYLKCFDAIPDAGAQFEIGIYADIPVDSDPNKILDFSTGSPGHTFIQVKKTNGSQSVVQNMGFYPKTGWKTGLTNAPIDAKFVDDGMHEFNAGFTKSLTAEEFKSALTRIRYLKNMQYDIDNYNCTDWALSVFNNQGGYGLDIPLYDIPGNLPGIGTSMPQGVYNRLSEMKRNNDAHADQIQIGFVKAWVANSNGPCGN